MSDAWLDPFVVHSGKPQDDDSQASLDPDEYAERHSRGGIAELEGLD